MQLSSSSSSSSSYSSSSSSSSSACNVPSLPDPIPAPEGVFLARYNASQSRWNPADDCPDYKHCRDNYEPYAFNDSEPNQDGALEWQLCDLRSSSSSSSSSFGSAT